jgi:hypothetical protein
MSLRRHIVSLLAGTMMVAGTMAIASPAGAAQQKSVIITAEGATGHLVSLSADFRARVTTTNFVPIRGLIIKMQDAGGAHHTVCTAVTNSLGEAYCQATASDDPLLIASFVATGYNAVFEGNGTYLPATAHGRITVTPL